MNATTSTSSTSTLVLSPDAVVRARNGKLQIACGGRSFETELPALLTWVLGFARPQPLQQVLAALPPDQRAPAADLIAQLKRIGVLVESAAPSAAHDPDSEHQASSRQVAELAQSVYALACDLRGLGPPAHAHTAQTGLPIAERLDGLLAGVASLRAELAALRPDHVGRQLTALGVNAQARGLKLHIGAGGRNLDGWINIDVHPAPLALNLQWGLPFADGHADRVFLSHLLEHLFYPQEATRLLAEIHRVLAPGGVVRIVVPDIEQCIQAYVKNDKQFFASRRHTWTWWPEGQTRLEDFLAYAGAGPNPGLLFESHKFGYDFETLARALERAGFSDVRRCGYMRSPHAELRVDAASVVAGATHGDQHYSLFVEATKG